LPRMVLPSSASPGSFRFLKKSRNGLQEFGNLYRLINNYDTLARRLRFDLRITKSGQQNGTNRRIEEECQIDNLKASAAPLEREIGDQDVEDMRLQRREGPHHRIGGATLVAVSL